VTRAVSPVHETMSHYSKDSAFGDDLIRHAFLHLNVPFGIESIIAIPNARKAHQFKVVE